MEARRMEGVVSSLSSDKENDPETNVVMTTTQTNSTSVDKSLQATNADKHVSFSVSKRKRPPICLDEFTPAIRRSGPLKKRIKDRCSLDSSYSLPMTPSGFFDITPNITLLKNESSSTRSTKVPPFRVPLKDISTNTTIFTNNDADIKKLKLSFSPAIERNHSKQRNRHQFPPTGSLSGTKTQPAEKAPSVSTNGKNLSSSSQQKSNCQGVAVASPAVAPKLLQPPSMPQSFKVHHGSSLNPTRLVGPTRKRPNFLLPKQHSRVAFKGSKIDDLSCAESNNTSLDGEIPNTYMGLMRQQLQFFEISTEEAAFCEAKNVPVHVGQVALRCRHCTCVSMEFRQRGSLIVAMHHNSLYRHFVDGKNIHVEELCPFVPSATKNQLKALRQRRGATLAKDLWFWSTKAKDEGVVETDQGLRFKSSLLMAKSSLNKTLGEKKGLLALDRKKPPPIRQQIDDGPFYSDENKTQTTYAKTQMTNPPNFLSAVGVISWDEKFLELKEFYEKNGHSNVPVRMGPLGRWVSKMRKAYKDYIQSGYKPFYIDRNEMDRRIRLLEGLNFSWNMMPSKKKKKETKPKPVWLAYLQEFIDFKTKNGHGRVSRNDPANQKLGVWVSHQRTEKHFKNVGRASSMTDEKERLLVEAGFEWKVDKTYVFFDKKFRELQKFYENNGHSNVPVTETALGRWVGTMRDVYKKYVNHGSIPANIDKAEMDRRIHLLEGLNFSWSLQDKVAEKVKLD